MSEAVDLLTIKLLRHDVYTCFIPDNFNYDTLFGIPKLEIYKDSATK